jgi:hypothetical protein
MVTPPSGHIPQLPAGVDLLQVLCAIAIGRSVVTDSVMVRPGQIKLTVTMPLSGLPYLTGVICPHGSRSLADAGNLCWPAVVRSDTSYIKQMPRITLSMFGAFR